jgi:uncharacterized cupin superfamily protein
MNPSWVDVGGPHPWEREAAVGEPEVGELLERPTTIVSVAEGVRYELPSGALDVDLGTPAGSIFTGLSHMTLPPDAAGYPPHCHSAEEEIFVVLEGNGRVLLGEEEHELRRGHVVSRPAGTRVAHSFRAGGEGLRYLAYSNRDPNDIAYYPRSNKINFRGVGVITRLERLDYRDGEPTD